MIYIAGEVLVDIFDDGNSKTFKPGGAPFNVAINISNLGKDVKFFGSLGNDENGKLISTYTNNFPHFQNEISFYSEYETSEAIVTLINGERSFHFNRENGADYHLNFDKFKEIEIKEHSIIHLGSLMISNSNGIKFIDDCLNTFNGNSFVHFSFDINYRSDIFENEDAAKKAYLNLIPRFDILKFSDEEVTILTGLSDIEKGLKQLTTPKQMVFLTCGKNGSYVYYQGRKLFVPTEYVKPIDTTGAGDAFYSYILYALDEKDFNSLTDEYLLSTLEKANKCGRLATQCIGAINNNLNLDALK